MDLANGEPKPAFEKSGPDSTLQSAIATVPPGKWAVGVSGGADSVALLLLLAKRSDLALHVVHLDHQKRGEDSTGDAAFVDALAERLKLPSTVAIRSEIEAGMSILPANPSSRYRAARLSLFKQVVDKNNLSGVIVAHHADDQAETVLLRLLRGSGPVGLAAMEHTTDLGGLQIARPLLAVHRDALRSFLGEQAQPWREDASNAGDDFLRNRLRRWLGIEPAISNELLELGVACRELRDWVRATAPRLEGSFAIGRLTALPPVLATESARVWLIEMGVSPDLISPAVVERLIMMAIDGASPPRAHFPGQILVRRREGRIFVSG